MFEDAKSDRLARMNHDSYERMASYFSQTRRYGWKDFSYFVPYIKEDIKILDLGCGNGRLIDFLNKNINSYKYHGIDVSAALIDEARKLVGKNNTGQNRSIFFEKADAIDRCVEADSYDMIFMIASLNHLSSDNCRERVLRSVYDSLCAGGVLCMTNWNLWRPTFKRKSVLMGLSTRFTMKNIRYLSQYGITPFSLAIRDVITRWRFGNDGVLLYYHAFTSSELNRLAIKIGFKVVMNRYSFDNAWRGGNIITILKKP